jgi:hypothetical protein
MATATATINLANDMFPASSSSGFTDITHFKNRQVPLPHPVFMILCKQA